MKNSYKSSPLKPAIWKYLAALLFLLSYSLGVKAVTTHTVTNTNASGSGSFHAAVVACSAGDIIDFNFSSGSAPWVINQTFQENITVANVTIKGNTASGYSGKPLIQLDGNNSLNYCLDVIGSGCTIIGLSITQYASAGIYVEASNCTIQNCFIGVKPDGSTYSGVFCAVWAIGVSGLNVDGETYGRNVFTTTDYPGVYFQDNGSGCSNATITGTYIGTDYAGTTALGTIGYGIYMDFHSSNISVGGSTTAKRCVICNCNNFGVHFGGSGNSCKGCYIGINSSGTAAIGNLYGVYSEGSGNTLGGTGSGEGNVISGNTQYGLFMDGFSNSASETIVGNIIGLNAAGTSAVANQAGGIYIQGTVGSGSNGHIIGGTTAAARNIISGNTGVGIYMAQTKGTVIEGNYIGLDAAGTTKIKNSFEGIYIDLNSSGTQVGGSTAAAGNVISGNGSVGVHIQGPSNTVQNNYIGTDPSGTSGLGNTSSGITIDASSGGKTNTISNNIISGNSLDGITLNGSVTASNTITGNTIGLNAAGTSALGNANNGITLKSFGNTIGGITSTVRNIISGNTKYGIQVVSSGASTIAGNYIGLNAAGTSAIGNGTNGIGLTGTGSTIGGTTSGSRNVISGNTGIGIEIISGTYTIQNNYIGLNAAGTAAIGNTTDGIKISSSTANTIGLTSSNSAANFISGNGGNGINIAVGSHTIGVNYIGLNGAQTGTLGNSLDGILVSSNGNTLGGSTSSISSDISGNTKNGIEITGVSNIVVNTIIGILPTGPLAPNSQNGILISGQSNTIGATSFALANVISGNTLHGISISGAGAKNNVVVGNFIGLDAGTVNAAANGGDGINISTNAAGNTIGGSGSGTANYIAGNTGNGINLASGTNSVKGNYIGFNSSFAIKANGQNGILINSSSNTIGGTAAGSTNVISGNTFAGISISGTSASNNIQGNYIGTDKTGASALANGTDGISIASTATSNTIGGATASAANIISGNNAAGIRVISSGTNTIQGNYLGLNAAGSGALGNNYGIILTGTAGITTIKSNVISGNTADGIYVASLSHIIKGNYIGLNATGTAAVANAGYGINCLSGSGGTIIGGAASGEGNVVSGNGSSGISLSGSGTNGLIANYIGLNATGTSAIANTGRGILITSSNNIIGASGSQNVISGNTSYGIEVNSGSGNAIQYNYIGLNAAGTSAVANGNFGLLMDGATSTTVDKNVISGNTTGGLGISVNSATITGNYIGLNAAGTSAIANAGYGAYLGGSASGVVVGGSTAAARNIISGNSGNGIYLNSGTHTIQGNYIGTDATGTTAVANGNYGIENNAGNSAIGGTTAGTGNVISGNTQMGLNIDGGSPVVKGNYIGLNAAGTSALPNSYGILINASSVTIGGNTSGAGNVISGNTNNGIYINATGATITGNTIGLNATGTSALGNGTAGILSSAAGSGATIGGSTAADGNFISGNGDDGITLPSANAIVRHNYVGTNATGTGAIANTGDGVDVFGTGADIADNVISGNNAIGIHLSTGGTGATVHRNIVGLNAAGNAAIANGNSGIWDDEGANTIGGNSASEGNVSSGNTNYGIVVNTSASAGSTVKNNSVGTDVSGTSAIANGKNGVELRRTGNTLSNNLIADNTGAGVLVSAGTNTISSNTITANSGKGVVVTSGTGNLISQNSISGNSFGIDLGNDGVTANDAGDGDAGANNLQNFPVFTSVSHSAGNTTIKGSLNAAASTTYTIELFANTTIDASGYGQGQTYIGNTTLTTNGSGNGNFNVTIAGTFSKLSATATDPSNNTSEFSLTTSPAITVKQSATVIANNTATPLFKDSTIIGVPIAHTYTIYNTGIEDLVVTSLNLPSGFTSTSGLPATITAGSNAGFDVTLSALANGSYSGNVTFNTNDPSNPTFKFAVQGWVGCWNTLYVDNTGSDANTGSASNNAKQTVQAAVNALCDGGTVYLKPGNTFNETVNSNGKSINVGFTTSSSSATTVTNLTVNGSGKTVTLIAPLTITGTLTMTNGILKTSSTAPLILSGNGSSVSGGSTSSYIDGPVQFSQTGTQTRTTTLPLGSGSVYRPISLYTDITDGASAGNTFQAQLKNVDPHTLGLTIPALTNLSYVRYYQVDHIVSNGTVNAAQITLPFINDATNDSINDLSNVKILKGNGAGKWISLNGTASGSASGSFYNGTITSGNFTTFSPFALATGCGSNPQPSVDFSYSNSCVGSSVTFTNNSTISSGNIVSYTWDYGDGSAQLTQSGTYPPNPANPTHTYTTTGTFTVNLEATSNLGCQVVLTKYITINQLPNATITGTPEVCSGSAATFTVNISNVASGDNWKLFYNEGASAKTMTGTGPGNFTLTTGNLASNTTVTLTSIQNTTTTCTQSVSGSASATVDPTTVAGSTSGAATVCSGTNSGSITLSGNTGAVVKWQYSIDGGSNYSDIANTSAVQTYNNITTTTLYRAIVQSGVCLQAKSSATTITVNALPTASINAGTSICAGTTAGLTVTVANTGGANWSIGYTEGTTAKTITGTGNGSFTLTTGTLSTSTSVTLNSITLTSGSPICSNSLSSVSSVTVNPKPTATVTLTNSTICFGSNPTFTLGISNVAAGETWSITYTTTNPSTTVTTTGTGSGNFNITTASLTGPSSAITITALSNSTTGCSNSSLPAAVTVTVNPLSVGGTTAGTATVCYSSNSGSVTLSGNTGNVVKWQSSTDAGATWFDIANTSTTLNYTNLTSTTAYRAVVQSGVCATANSASTTITVNSLPTASINSGTTVCSGTTASLTVTVANTGGANWSISYQEGSATKTLTGTGNGSVTLTTGTLTTNTDVTLLSITETSGSPACSNTLSSKATVVVNPLPSATIGSGSTICNGSTATISVEITDVASTDNWTLSYNEGATAKTLSGTGSGTFTITTAALASNTTVTLTSIKNTTSNCTQAESGSATITVNPTSVGGTTAGTATVCNGSNSGSVTLSGNTGNVVKWQSSTDAGATWFDIANTSTTLNYTNLTSTTAYRAVVQSGVCATANSASTTITVNSLPTASINSGTTICSGTTASLTVTVANTGGANWSISYQEGSATKTLTGTGNGSVTLTTGTLTTNTDVTLLSITETSGSPACSNTLSSKATVVVNPLPSATIGSGSTICNGSTATISVEITDVASTDNWTLSYNEGATAKTLSGTGSGTFTITTAALASNTTVTLTSIKNTTSNCTQAESGSTTITVNPTSVGGTTAGTATVCNGSNSGSVTLSGNTGNVVKWQSSTDAGATWYDIANTSTKLNYSNLTSTTAYRAVIQSGVCATANSSSTSITVNNLPTASINSGTTVCSGTTAGLTVTVGNTLGASWSISYQEGSATKTLTGTGNGSFTLTTGTLTTNTDVTLLSITETSGSPTCSNTLSSKATVVVNPLPAATIGSGSTICNGSTATIAVSVSDLASTDGWKLSYTEGATAKSITGTGPGNYTITTSALAVNTTVTLTGIQNTTTTCSQSLSGSATITVNPTSVGGTTAGTATVCYGSNSGSVTLSGNTGNVVKWQYSIDAGTTWTDIANTTATQKYNNITTTTIYQAVVQSGICAATTSSQTTITVNALPTVSISGGTTICALTTATLTLNISNVTALQTWSVNYLEGSNSMTVTGTGSGSFTFATSTLSATTNYVLQSISISSGAPTCSNSNLTGNTSATVTVNPLPSATIGSGSTICNGSTATINVSVSNVASTDGWKLSYNEGATAKSITGTGPGNFTITTSALAANTTVTLTGIQNTTTSCSQSLSGSATITVNPTSVGGTTAGTGTVCYGSNSGSVTLSGNTGNIVKWQYSIDGGTTWTDIANTTTTQKYNNITNTTIYQAVVQSGVCAAVSSSQTTITVNQLPNASISGSTTICSGTTAGLTVTTSNTFGQSWSLSYLEGTTSKTLTGTGNGNFTLTTSALTSNTDIELVSIVLTSGSPLCSNGSITGNNLATVKVNPIPTASISGSQTICTGSTPVFYVTVSNVPSGNGWTLSYSEGGTAKTLTGTGSGTFAMNPSALTNASASPTTVTYTLTNIVNTTNVPNCNSVTFTGTYVVTISPTTVGGSLSGTTTACGTVNSGSMSLTGNVGAVLRWEYSIDNGSTWTTIANTATFGSYLNLSTTTIYRVLVQSGACAAVYSSTATITVNPQPTASMSGSQTICSGNVPAISVTVSNVPSGMSWSLSYTEGATNKTLTGTGSGTFTLNASTLTNSGTTQSTVTYSLGTITNTFLSCTSVALTSTYTVKIDPVTNAGTLSASPSVGCYGNNSGTITLSGQVGTIVRWEYSNDGGSTWVYVSNTNNSIAFNNLTNTTIYRVLVQSGVCAAGYSSQQTITVNPLPTASISGDASVCTGSASVITFTVNNVTSTDKWTINYTVNGTAAAFNGTGPGSFTYTTPVMTYPPLNVVYSLLSVNNNTTGCGNAASGKATIQVNPKPVVNYTETDMCLGYAISFANKTTIPAGNIAGYKWDFGDGSTSTNISPDHIFAAAGSYNVRLVATSVYGCKDSITRIVTVFPKPVASYTSSNTCQSDSAVFTSTSTVSSGKVVSWAWDFGDGSTSSLSNPKHKYTYTGTFDVTLTVTTDKGCVNSITKTETVYPLPVSSFNASQVCAYDSTQFINNSTVAYGSLSYSWTFEPGKTSTLKEPKYKFSSAGSFVVKLIVTSSFGCKDSTFRTITVNPVPKPQFTYLDVCIGKESDFANTSTVATGTITGLEWNLGDSTFVTGPIVKHTYAYVGTYKVILRAISDKGCRDTISHIETIHALPSAKITSAGPLAVCFGNSVTLSAPSGLTYLWSTGAKTQSITVNKTGTYTVVTTNAFGCSSTDSAHVIIWPLPIVRAGNDTTVSKGFSAHLHASGALTYSWTPTSTLDNPNIYNPFATPLITTSYIVAGTDIHNCVNTDTVIVNVIDDHLVITYNTITPNGDGKNDTWVIDNIGTFPGAILNIYNRYGQVLYTTNDYKNDWRGTYNGQDLPEGTYYYTISFPDNSRIYKGAINILRNNK